MGSRSLLKWGFRAIFQSLETAEYEEKIRFSSACHLSHVQPSANYLTFLNLNFLWCKTEQEWQDLPRVIDEDHKIKGETTTAHTVASLGVNHRYWLVWHRFLEKLTLLVLQGIRMIHPWGMCRLPATYTNEVRRMDRAAAYTNEIQRMDQAGPSCSKFRTSGTGSGWKGRHSRWSLCLLIGCGAL